MTAEKLFKILGNKIRLRLLCLLRERDLRVGDLQAITGLPTAMVSKDLMRLRARGLVSAVRRGVSITYSIPKTAETDALRALLADAAVLMPPEIAEDAAKLSRHVPAEAPRTDAPEKSFVGNAPRGEKRRAPAPKAAPRVPAEPEGHFAGLPPNLL